VVLVVNVASKCGLTPQYAALEKLQQQFKGKGFNVLGLPCNQFAGQEPGSAEEIQEFCSRNYGVSFPLSEKLEVNGSSVISCTGCWRARAPSFLVISPGTSRSSWWARMVACWRVSRHVPRRTIRPWQAIEKALA
jgi:hypothetical protein